MHIRLYNLLFKSKIRFAGGIGCKCNRNFDPRLASTYCINTKPSTAVDGQSKDEKILNLQFYYRKDTSL